MIFALATALLQAAVPAVAPAAPRPSVITAPDWLRKPTGADMAEFYPKAAAASHIEGRATIRCRVAASGDLTDCTSTSEEPGGQGFGEAALHLSSLFKMRPMTKDGVPASGGQINIPIRFALPKAERPTLEFALECYGASAAALEKDPSTPQTQLEVFAWRMVVELLTVSENLRPSELERRLAAAARMGGSAGENPQCKRQLPADALSSLQSMITSATANANP